MPTKPKKLTRSQEDYLEAIWALICENRVARVRDIAHRLGVSMPSVTSALRTLAGRGLVNYDPYQVITLTEEGRKAAEEVDRRHHVLRDFLIDVLGLDAPRAEANACRMEHAIDRQALERIGRLTEALKDQPPLPPARKRSARRSRRKSAPNGGSTK